MADYETHPIPLTRRLVVDAGQWNRRKHIIHIVVEFDVTRPRELIRRRTEATGERLSFTAYVAACVGRAVAADRTAHAYRKGRRLVLYRDVDIGILVERLVEGENLATYHVVRQSDRKPVEAIHAEIRAAQGEVVEAMPGARAWKAFLALPAVFRRPFYWWLDRHPETRKRLSGTVVISAIGMYGKGGGWGIPIPSNTLTITVGGIATKPRFVEGRIEPREMLGVTVSFDHDVVDGAPAARFVARLRDRIEDAELLAD